MHLSNDYCLSQQLLCKGHAHCGCCIVGPPFLRLFLQRLQDVISLGLVCAAAVAA